MLRCSRSRNGPKLKLCFTLLQAESKGGGLNRRKTAGPSGLPFPPQLNLRGNLAVSWKRFKRVWENYEIAAGLAAREKSSRVATLLTFLGPDAIESFDGFTFAADADKEDPDKIMERFANYCVGETNETYERYMCLFKRKNT